MKNVKKNKKLRTKSNVHGIQTTDIKDREVETFIINCFGDCIKKNYKPKKEINFELMKIKKDLQTLHIPTLLVIFLEYITLKFQKILD